MGAEEVTGDGVAHVYRRTGSSWAPEQKLSPVDGVVGTEFGHSLSLASGELVVGAPLAQEGGAAYVYRFEDGRWHRAQTLTALAAAAGGDFGRHVAHTLDRRVLIVGASRSDGHATTRAVAHLFQRDHASWCHVAVLERFLDAPTEDGARAPLRGHN